MNDNDNSQRKGALSNYALGQAFKITAQKHFKNKHNIDLVYPSLLKIDFENKEKKRCFDFGSDDPKILVKCKRHKWRKRYHVPNAKIIDWDNVMACFRVAPPDYKKILFCLKDDNELRKETLAEYYIKKHVHLILIAPNVEIWEYCEATDNVVIYDSL